MEELELLHDIVSTLSKSLKVPVTCKTRIYRNDFERSVRLCETLVNAGASMLTIHGRGREEKGSLVADADWDMIQKLKEHFGERVPIIANGGIETMDDVQRCLKHTAADGVMSSEAILENPALFHAENDGDDRTLIDIALEYLEMVQRYPGTDRQIKIIRNHLMKFLYRYFVVHEDLRNKTAEQGSIEAFEETVRELKSRVPTKQDDEKYTEVGHYILPFVSLYT
jgi:tRNA-dihydrouridine synthase 1